MVYHSLDFLERAFRSSNNESLDLEQFTLTGGSNCSRVVLSREKLKERREKRNVDTEIILPTTSWLI